MFKFYKGEFKEDYKAKAKSCEDDNMSQAFQEVVTWCINNEIDKLKEVLDSKSSSLYKEIIFSALKDQESGYNLREIVASTGRIDVMKAIHLDYTTDGPVKHLYLGKALEVAISKENLGMVQCILSRDNPKIPKVLNYLQSAFEPQRFEIFREIATYIHRNKNKYHSFYGESPNYQDLLTRAINDERLDLVKVLMTTGACPNEGGGKLRELPLLTAMKTGNFAIVECLIQNGSIKIFSDIIQDVPIEYLNLRLISAIEKWTVKDKRNFQRMMNHLTNDCEINESKIKNKLDEVIKMNRLDLMKRLFVQVTLCENVDSKFPLHNAVQLEKYEFAEFLVNNGAGLFVHDKKGSLPDDYLIEKAKMSFSEDKRKSVAKLKYLISSKMKANREMIGNEDAILDVSGCGLNEGMHYYLGRWNNPHFQELIAHCINGNIDGFQESNHGSFVKENIQDLKTGYRAIDFAAYHGQTDLVKRLLKYGAKAEVIKNFKAIHSAIDVAKSRGHQEVLNVLFEYGIEVENQMIIAVQKGNLKVVEHLLQDIDIDFVNAKYKFNALHLASKFGKLDFVKLLVNNGANVNMKSLIFDRSPLHFAAWDQNLKVVEYLVDHNADIFQKDISNHTALDLARNSKGDPRLKDEIVKYLSYKMVDIGDQSKNEIVSRKRSVEQSVDYLSNSNNLDSSFVPLTKLRKTEMKDNSTSTDLDIEQETSQEESSRLSRIRNLMLPLKNTFTSKIFSYPGKMASLSAIDVIISRESMACSMIAEKEVIDEFANLVGEIISKDGVEKSADFVLIARILAKLNSITKGKKLISDMKLSFGAFDKLKAEMKKYEVDLDRRHFAFDSDCVHLDVKSELKEETIKSEH